MKEKCFKFLAGLCQARHTTPDPDVRLKHDRTIFTVVKNILPNGSGFDNGTTILTEKCSDVRLVFKVGFHHMNQHGFYTGWTHHEVIVTPNLASDFDVRVTGRNIHDIKDYIAETFIGCLRTTIDTNKMTEAFYKTTLGKLVGRPK